MFKLQENGTTVRTELLAGLTTYVTMVYIAFVNPTILADAGMDRGAVFVATCLAAAFGSAMMGLYANYPVALAPGMGLNAYFTYGVVKGLGHTWETALGAVFLSGVLFMIVSLTGIREWVINAVPRSLKLSIAAGIGLFLAIIGLQSAGIIVAHPATLVTLGNLKTPGVLIAATAFVVIAALDARKVPGAILIGILAAAAAGIALGLSKFSGVVSLPPSIAPVFLKLDIVKALEIGLVAIVFTFFFVDVFDNTGTLVGVAQKAGLRELLDWLEQSDVVRAVATSTRRDRAEAQLTQQGLLQRFATLVGGNEVERGKPEPDIFLLAATRLSVAPEDCVVLEDSEPGMRAALAAGMMPIMVPDLHAPSPDLLASAPLVLPSLHEVRVHLASLPH